ncbi:MAG: hypothetical protein C4K58_02970 [Flavobacteriaceae bacterium]|nr:MAG: hypothetical protein C4K58_02970 [Flavobacteriaceae bacterium]
MKEYHFEISVEWTGNKGSGTFSSESYSRDSLLVGKQKSHAIEGSSDSAFLGDDSKYNPQELFIGAISQCHMM